jgi:hypothetical protein
MKKVFLPLVMLLAMATYGLAAIANNTSADEGATQSFTVNAAGSAHTVLHLTVYSSGAGSLVGAAWFNGATMTAEEQENNGTSGRAEVWSLVNPASGAHTLNFIFSSTTPTAFDAHISSYDGVASLGAVNGASQNLVGGVMPLSGTAVSGRVSVYVVGSLNGGHSIFNNGGASFVTRQSATTPFAWVMGDIPGGTNSANLGFYCGCNDQFTGATLEMLPFVATATPSPTFTISQTPTRTQTLTPTYTRSASPTPTWTQSFTNSPTSTFTNSPTRTVTPSFTQTSSASPTFSVSPTPTPTFTITPTWTPSGTPTPPVGVPTNVSVGVYQQPNCALLTWNDDANVVQWFITMNGKQLWSPVRSATGLTWTAGGTPERNYLMTNIAAGSLPGIITMKALAFGTLSGASSPVTLTTAAPPAGATEVYNEPGYPLYVSLSNTGSSGAATAALQTTGNNTLTSVLGVLQGASSTAAPFNIQNIYPATGPYALTLTGTTAWTWSAITCTAQPCDVYFFNQSPADKMLWWIDNSTSAPAFDGLSQPAGAGANIINGHPGMVFHWRYPSASDNGFLIDWAK